MALKYFRLLCLGALPAINISILVISCAALAQTTGERPITSAMTDTSGYTFADFVLPVGTKPSDKSTDFTGICVNDSGQVAGSYVDSIGNTHAFIYDAGKITPISERGWAWSNVIGINNSGQVAGNAHKRDGVSEVTFGFIYSKGTTEIVFPTGVYSSYIRGINSSGVVVGNFMTGTAPPNIFPHGFEYNNGSFTELKMGSIYGTNPTGITDVGQVFGSYFNQNKQFTYFIFNRGTPYTLVLAAAHLDLAGGNNSGQIAGSSIDPSRNPFGFIFDSGTPSGSDKVFSYPGAKGINVKGINKAGQVAGTISINNADRGFVFSGGVVTLLPPISQFDEVQGITNSGVVFGHTGTGHGFVYKDNVVTILDPPGAVNVRVYGASESGLLVGYYLDGNNQWHDFVATPPISLAH